MANLMRILHRKLFKFNMKLPSARIHFFTLLYGFALSALLANSTLACDVTRRSWPNLIVSIIDPAAEQFWLHIPDSTDAQIVVSRVGKTYDTAAVTLNKRVRIAAGHPIEIEQLRDRKNDANILKFRSARGSFDGTLSLTNEDRVMRSNYITPNANGTNYLIAIKYKHSRSIPDALTDSVCAYMQVPALLAEDN